MSRPVNPFHKVAETSSKSSAPDEAKQKDSNTRLRRLNENVQEALEDVTSQTKEIIRHAKKMFSDADEFKKKWPPQVKLFYDRLRNPLLRG